MVDLDELMRLHDTATPGPWKTNLGNFDSDGYSMVIRPYIEADGKITFVSNDDTDYGYDEDDAAYICAACNAVPELVKDIRELEGTVVRLGLMLADAYKYIDPARLPEISTSVMATPTLQDMIEKFRRENFTEDTAEAEGKDHA